MGEREHTAVFIGHSECYRVTAETVNQAIITLIDQGVTTFISGGQGGFDRLCAVCVSRLRQKYPDIRNLLVIPYLAKHNIEGIVFWKDGEPRCKIKRKDFGYKWPAE